MATRYSVGVTNSAIFGKTIEQVRALNDKDFVVAKLCRVSGEVEIPTSDTKLYEGDRLLVISVETNKESVATFFGDSLDISSQEWAEMDSRMATRNVIVTKPKVNGKTLGELKVRSVFGVNVVRVNRAGVDLVAQPGST